MRGAGEAAGTAVRSAPSPATAGAGSRRHLVPVPRLERRTLTLDDGHEVGLAVCGHGIPLVVVHGFSAEGILYAQTLSRLVAMGFKVVAIDVAGHGGSQGLPAGGASLSAYARLLARALDTLGIRRAVLAGHSLGGRLVTEVAATEPSRALAVVLLDAIVGDAWDRRVNLFRLSPPLLGALGVLLAADTASTLPVVRDRRQAAKLARLLAPVLAGHLRRPWRLTGPGLSILRSQGSRWMLERLAAEHVPVVVIQGDRDFVVPVASAESAARRARGELVTVLGASHSWLLKDPETLPAIVAELLGGRLGRALDAAVAAAGLDPDDAGLDDIEGAFYAADAPVLAMSPPQGTITVLHPARRPRYPWTITDHSS